MRHSLFRKLFFVLMIFGFVYVHGEVLTLQGTLVDLSNVPVEGATLIINDDLDEIHQTLTNEDGSFFLEIQFPDSVSGTKTIPFYQTDWLKGNQYHLESRSGSMIIYNVLGQQVLEFQLSSGKQILNRFLLPTGKYFMMMKTPAYQAVSSFTLIQEEVVGVGHTRVLKDIRVHPVSLKKELDRQLSYLICKTGFDTLQNTFSPDSFFMDASDTIRINRLPVWDASIPSTLWQGFNLTTYLIDDNNGYWTCLDSSVSIPNVTLCIDSLFSGSVQTWITYHDSLDENIQLKHEFTIQDIHEKKKALLMVVENNFSLGGDEVAYYYNLVKASVVPALAAMFNIPENLLNSMSLVKIVDVYGEAYVIDEMIASCSDYYDTIIALTDETATRSDLINQLTQLAQNHDVIDMVFYLHGSKEKIWLTDRSYRVEDITNELAKRAIPLRALYQTNCHGSFTIDEWEETGCKAVSGAKGLNHFGALAPLFFMKAWTTGIPFDVAVDLAIEQELDAYNYYKTLIELPESWINQVWPSEDDIEDSRQNVGGTNPQLFWNQF